MPCLLWPYMGLSCSGDFSLLLLFVAEKENRGSNKIGCRLLMRQAFSRQKKFAGCYWPDSNLSNQ